MRNLHELDHYRLTDQSIVRRFGGVGDDTCGVFRVPVGVAWLRVIASAAEGWDHVSVSTKMRCPSWREMDYIKRRFFRDNEVAYQLHVTPADHINCHPYTLHLWRPHDRPIPLPPTFMV